MTTEGLIAGVLRGEARAIGRAISVVETGPDESEALLRGLYPHTGRAAIVGITGPPGAGKSTLVDRMVGLIRDAGRRVGVVAIDPSSPFSGGAVLGDRVRMQDRADDWGVFIRSMSARGELGGLAEATSGAVQVLDAAGMETILVETVGVGQSEMEIAATADTTVLVLTPAAGDSIQFIKAGIIEVADIFVVNKADMEGSARMVRDVKAMLHARERGGWTPPVIATESTANSGIESLIEAIERHRDHLVESGELATRRRERLRREVEALVTVQLRRRAAVLLEAADEIIRRVERREITPGDATHEIMSRL